MICECVLTSGEGGPEKNYEAFRNLCYLNIFRVWFRCLVVNVVQLPLAQYADRCTCTGELLWLFPWLPFTFSSAMLGIPPVFSTGFQDSVILYQP